ncbi:MAG: hypothetical protein JO161_00945 [Planctomycetaceae bacterium]|nr:hypothetical protein [Planctomycetaceae bacterium]
MLIQRYGKVFGDGSGTNQENPPIASEPAAATNAASAPQTIVPQLSPGSLAERSKHGQFIGPPPTVGPPPAEILKSVEPPRKEGESGEGVIILENDSAERPDPPARPALRDGSGDEIMFIE